jgi:hypothetical protein
MAQQLAGASVLGGASARELLRDHSLPKSRQTSPA